MQLVKHRQTENGAVAYIVRSSVIIVVRHLRGMVNLYETTTFYRR